MMTPELQAAWTRLDEGSVLITGRAGTGNSTLLKEYCAAHRHVVRLAPTLS
jgi:Tfp pilus assembly pilus retraction ATPase PilT